jgi:hypothetical protein
MARHHNRFERIGANGREDLSSALDENDRKMKTTGSFFIFHRDVNCAML